MHTAHVRSPPYSPSRPLVCFCSSASNPFTTTAVKLPPRIKHTCKFFRGLTATLARGSHNNACNVVATWSILLQSLETRQDMYLPPRPAPYPGPHFRLPRTGGEKGLRGVNRCWRRCGHLHGERPGFSLGKDFPHHRGDDRESPLPRTRRLSHPLYPPASAYLHGAVTFLCFCSRSLVVASLFYVPNP